MIEPVLAVSQPQMTGTSQIVSPRRAVKSDQIMVPWQTQVPLPDRKIDYRRAIVSVPALFTGYKQGQVPEMARAVIQGPIQTPIQDVFQTPIQGVRQVQLQQQTQLPAIPNMPGQTFGRPLPPLPPTGTPFFFPFPGIPGSPTDKPRRKRHAYFTEHFYLGLDMSIRTPRKGRAKLFRSPKHPKKVKSTGGKKK